MLIPLFTFGMGYKNDNEFQDTKEFNDPDGKTEPNFDSCVLRKLHRMR